MRIVVAESPRCIFSVAFTRAHDILTTYCGFIAVTQRSQGMARKAKKAAKKVAKRAKKRAAPKKTAAKKGARKVAKKRKAKKAKRAR
jgi:hypothetical protein